MQSNQISANIADQNNFDFNLLKVENGRVSARNLYKFLGLAPAVVSRWLQEKIVNNDFAVESEDWVGVNINVEGNKLKDYLLSINFAKKLCMKSDSVNGEKVRDYFIRWSKKLYNQKNSPLKNFLQQLWAIYKS